MQLRRWLQFSLRTLLLAVLLFGSATSLWWHWDPWVVRLELPIEDVQRVSFSKNGELLLISSGDDFSSTKQHRVELWNVHRRKRALQKSFPRYASPFRARFSQTEKWLVIPHFNRYSSCLIDSTTGEYFQFKSDDRPAHIDCLFDNDLKALIQIKDGNHNIVNIPDGKVLGNITFNLGPKLSPVFYISPDGKCILTPGLETRAYDSDTAELMFRFSSDQVYWHVQFSEDSTMFWTQLERTISVYSTATGRKITTFENIANGGFSPDGKLFVTNHSSNEAAGIARIWRLDTLELIATLQQVPAGCWLWFTNDGQRIGGYGDKSLHMWQLNRPEPLVHIPDYVAADDDFLRAISLGHDSDSEALWLWDTRTGKRIARLRAARLERIDRILFSPTNEHIVIHNYDNVVVWERRRPESIFGVFFLPGFWLTITFAPAFFWSLFRDRCARHQ